MLLTISTHPCSHALLKSAVLTSIAVDSLNGALLILGAGTIINLLLDGSPEESLK